MASLDLNLRRNFMYLVVRKRKERLNVLKLRIFVIKAIIIDYIRKYQLKSPYFVNEYDRSRYLHRLIYSSDKTCHEQLRMDRYTFRNRKGFTATNVLGVCSQDMQFIYVLAGWEGSAADGRVLRDALSRRNGLPIQDGFYYLVDAGYTNGKGFLAPYRGQKYHLSEWRTGRQPSTPEEYFNMKHSSARNVIERCFGMLKMRWGIIRNSNFYPIKQQGRIIMACCLLQNHIRVNMSIDPIEIHYGDNAQNEEARVELDGDPITSVEPTQEWTDLRNNLATQMFNQWMQNRHDLGL